MDWLMMMMMSRGEVYQTSENFHALNS